MLLPPKGGVNTHPHGSRGAARVRSLSVGPGGSALTLSTVTVLVSLTSTAEKASTVSAGGAVGVSKGMTGSGAAPSCAEELLPSPFFLFLFHLFLLPFSFFFCPRLTALLPLLLFAARPLSATQGDGQGEDQAGPDAAPPRRLSSFS